MHFFLKKQAKNENFLYLCHHNIFQNQEALVKKTDIYETEDFLFTTNGILPDVYASCG